MYTLYLPIKNVAGPLFFCACFLVFSGPVSAQPGALDSTFNSTGSFILDDFPFTEVQEVIVQPDGKILTCAYAEGPTNLDLLIYRVNPDGTPDNTFGTGGYVLRDVDGGPDNPGDLELLPDGKILVLITSFSRTLFLRLNPDGSPDQTFGNDGLVLPINSLPDEWVNKMVIQPDGKIVTVGFYRPIFKKQGLLRRYLPDGSEDVSFSGDGAANLTFSSALELDLQDVVLQADGKILATGRYGELTTAAMVVARVNTDGSMDSTFSQDGKIIKTIGMDSDYSGSVLVQPDGKIIVAGSAFFGNSIQMTMLRYKTDGSTDNAFGSFGKSQTTIGIFSEIWSLLLQPDNKIIASGYSYNQTTGKYVYVMTRWNSNGTLDQSFGTQGKVVFSHIFPSYLQQVIVETCLQSDGKIVAVGYGRASGANGATQKSVILRFLSGLTVGVDDIGAADVSQALVYPNPVRGAQCSFEYDLSQSGRISLSLYDVKGAGLNTFVQNQARSAGYHQEQLTLPADLAPGVYFLRLDTEQGTSVTQIVKE